MHVNAPRRINPCAGTALLNTERAPIKPTSLQIDTHKKAHDNAPYLNFFAIIFIPSVPDFEIQICKTKSRPDRQCDENRDKEIQ